jgi:hypothetical protein
VMVIELDDSQHPPSPTVEATYASRKGSSVGVSVCFGLLDLALYK